jgi:hypothetical protein
MSTVADASVQLAPVKGPVGNGVAAQQGGRVQCSSSTQGYLGQWVLVEATCE